VSAVLYNVSLGALLALTMICGRQLIGFDGLRGRRIPWVAITLTALVVAGLALQLVWSGAMDALDSDPTKSGWWRTITSVFMQNGGLAGDAWNLATILVIAALAEWFWGHWLTIGLFLVGILLPHHLDVLLGVDHVSYDPRNFAGSSGATYFLGATLIFPQLIRTRVLKERLLALGLVALGLVMWFAQDNAHGLVWEYGVVVGAATYALTPKRNRLATRQEVLQ
jgi:hypothetical protein